MRIKKRGLVCVSLVFGALSWTETPQAYPEKSTSPVLSCTDLANRKIAASSIGLPTTGATVGSATPVPASGLTVAEDRATLPIPEYCKVLGSIAPVDPAAPNINFQINLPTTWNRKLAQLGGSGYNGVIPIALNSGPYWGPESIPPNAPYALSRGFVVYGSDSGHQSGANASGRSGSPNDWPANDEALANFAYAQMKKTHDVAVAIAEQFYGQTPRHSYYLGSSQGGREALMVVQRFPQDYDGVFAQVPVFPGLQWALVDPVLRLQAQSGDGWIPPEKIPLIAKEVLRQCDALDGIADGLVSKYKACNDNFDPVISPNAFAALRCPDGKDTGNTCLSDAQIQAVNQIHGAIRYPYPIYKGWQSFPGWTTGGESASNWKNFQTKPNANSVNVGILRNLLRDPNFDPLTFRLENYKDRIQKLSAELDAVDPDLSAFRKRGGKLIWKVNTTDYAANPRWSYQYYEDVVKTMGQKPVDSFLRFYVAVGIFHNRNIGRNPITNELVPNYLDFISLLDDWVETGKAPADTQVLVDMDIEPPFAIHSSFPMCRYPLYPQYKGTGDPKQSATYVCSKQ